MSWNVDCVMQVYPRVKTGTGTRPSEPGDPEYPDDPVIYDIFANLSGVFYIVRAEDMTTEMAAHVDDLLDRMNVGKLEGGWEGIQCVQLHFDNEAEAIGDNTAPGALAQFWTPEFE